MSHTTVLTKVLSEEVSRETRVAPGVRCTLPDALNLVAVSTSAGPIRAWSREKGSTPQLLDELLRTPHN